MLNPILLPIENKLEDFSTALIDTPGQVGENENEISSKIRAANCILILYDMTDEETVKNIKDFWLPLVHKYNTKVPVIIVGNKLDLIRISPNLSHYTRIGKILKPLMREFDVQTSVNTSASSNGNRSVCKGIQKYLGDALLCSKCSDISAWSAHSCG